MTTPTPTPNNMPGAQPQGEPNPQMQQAVSTAPPPAPAAPQPPPEQATPPAPQQPPAKSPETDDKKETDWKAHARTWEQRAKENEEKAKKWEEEQAAKRTKEENDRIAIEQANERARKAEEALIRERVARETGVLPDFLAGGSEEEMRANAQRLIEWRGPQGNSQQAPPPQTAAVPASTVTSADKMGSAPNGVQQLTKEQFVALPPAERMEAVRNGQCTNIGIGKPKEQRRMGNEVETGAHGARTART